MSGSKPPRRRTTLRRQLVPVPRALRGGEHDYVRCEAGWCGYLNRSDHVARRFKETNQGCQMCGGRRFVEPQKITLEEINRIRSGGYEEYDHVSTAI